VDPAFGIHVLGGGNLFVDRDRQPQLLHHLSGQAGLEAFTRLPFAAGKLPEPAEMSAVPSLGDQDLIVFDDEAGRHLDLWSDLSH
jgi:hypothetical protein